MQRPPDDLVGYLRPFVVARLDMVHAARLPRVGSKGAIGVLGGPNTRTCELRRAVAHPLDFQFQFQEA